MQAARVHVAVAALAGRPELATTSIAGALSSHSAPLGKRLFDHILHILPQQALKEAGSFSCGGARKKRWLVSRKSVKGCARPALPRKAQPRRAALTLQLAVASRSAFRPSIGMPPPSKASVIEMCWSSRRLVPFDLRVGHLYGRLPSCIVSWFRFDPQQRCLVLGRCTWRAWFSSWKMAFGVPKTPFSPRCAGGYIESAG